LFERREQLALRCGGDQRQASVVFRNGYTLLAVDLARLVPGAWLCAVIPAQAGI